MRQHLDPRTLGADCASCPYAREGKAHKPVYASGPANPKAVLTGEGPGRDEEDLGRPFVGATGKELDDVLARNQIARDSLYLINATLCRPINKTEHTMQRAVKCCALAFQTQVRAHLALPNLTLGKHAWVAYASVTNSKLPKGGLEKGRGFVRNNRHIGTWHPTYAFFRNPWVRGEFEVDVARFARLLKGTLRARPALITSPTLQDIKRLASSPFPIAVDVETAPQHPSQPWTGKDPMRAKLRTIGLGNINEGLSFVWRGADRDIIDFVKRLLFDKRIIKLYQNGIWFDMRLMNRYHLPTRNFRDTRDMRRAVSASSRLRLDYMASLYDDTDAWKEGDEDDEKGLVFTDDMEDLCRYNAQDTVETARVDEGIRAEPEWDTPRVQRLYALHLRTSALAARMHTYGVGIDQNARAQLDVSLSAEFERRFQILLNTVNVPAFKAAPEHLRALLFKRHETESIRRFSLPDPMDDKGWTEDGDISVDQKALLTLITDPSTPKEAVEIIDLYWQALSVRKARSTYVVSKKVEQAIGPDMRLRSGWNSCGTETGRWSASEPNLMNLSKKKE